MELKGVILLQRESLVLANAPHLFWSLLAGVFVILFLSTIQFQISRKTQNHEETNLFYFLFLVVLMIGAGTIVHAMKGSQIYTIASPVQYDLVKAINLVVLAGCLGLTFVSLILTWKGWGRR